MRRGGGFRGDRRALRRSARSAQGGDPGGDRKTRRFHRSIQAALPPGSVSGGSAEVRFEQGEATAGIALAGSTSGRLSGKIKHFFHHGDTEYTEMHGEP